MEFRLGKSQLLALLLVLLAITIVSCRTSNPTTDAEQDANDGVSGNLKLQVEEDGVYRVTQRELTNAGLDMSELTIENLRLRQGGQIVPLLIVDNSLIFYGEAPDSRYVTDRSYILEIGESGLEMPVIVIPEGDQAPVSKVLQTTHLEENHEYASEARQTDRDDVWFWYKLRQQDVFSTEVELAPIETEPAKIRLNVWGFTYDREIDGDHSIDLLINDRPVGEVVWDGQVFETAEMDIPAGVLLPGTNKITIDNRPEGASFLDIMHINWIEIDYFSLTSAVDDRLIFPVKSSMVQIEDFSGKPIVLDISTPTAPKLIENFGFDKDRLLLSVNDEMVIAAIGPNGFHSPRIEQLRTSAWHDDEHQADLIIVTTDDLAPSLSPLIKTREEQGLTVALVPVEEIYDEFGFGEASPESIKQFITYAHENWQAPAPSYLFLVGDATIDFLGHISEIPANTIPSVIVPVQFSGETVSDSRLADIDGDTKPEMAVGRWPVRTEEEVESLVERTLAYEQGSANEKVIFAVDDSESRFSSIASELTRTSNLPQDQVRILEGPLVGEITAELNGGSWLATYIGHGSIGRWGKEGIFELDAVDGLAADTPPILIQLTCLTGLFSHPEEISLTEAMLNHPNGPVLTVAATSLTLSGHQEPFARELLKKLQDPSIVRMGDAFQEAKLSLDVENSKGLREISDTFALFGDPSTIIVRP